MKPALLELLRRTAGTPQAILLTDDEDVASWARLEALAGELTVLEPSRPGSPDAPGIERRSGFSSAELGSASLTRHSRSTG